jgi:sphingomyelin phosphodiesterase
MADELKPDMIIWTGDNIAHDIWHQNETYQPVPTEIATKFIKKYLPGVPLFPVFGKADEIHIGYKYLK